MSQPRAPDDPPIGCPPSHGSDIVERRRWARFSTAVFRKFLSVYPSDVVSEFGEGMVQTFAENLSRRAGLTVAPWVARECLSVLARASVERAQRARLTTTEMLRILGSGPFRSGLMRSARSPFRSLGASLMVGAAAGLVTVAASLHAGITRSVVALQMQGPQYLVFGTDHVRQWERTHLGASELVRLGREATSVETVGAFTAPVAIHWIDHSGRSRSIAAVHGTPSSLEAIGLDASHGTLRTSVDEPKVIVTHEFWMSDLGGHLGVVGTSISLGRRAHRVVGILPPRSRSPDFSEFDVWIPLSSATAPPGPDGTRGFAVPQYLGVVSLDDDSSPTVAEAEMRDLAAGAPDRGIRLVSRSEYPFERVRVEVRVLMLGALGLSALALLELAWIAGVRRRDDEIRTSLTLGATPTALWMEEVVSVGVVSGLAAIVGTAGAFLLVPHLPMLMSWPDVASIRPSLFAGPAVALAFGVAHALGAAARFRRVSVGHRPRPSRTVAGRVLLAAQSSTSLVLLVVAGAFAGRFVSFSTNAPGHDRPRVLVVSTDLAALSPEALREMQTNLPERAAAHASAEAVGLWAPDTPDQSFWFDDIAPAGRPAESRTLPRVRIGGEALGALGIELVEGRGFSRADQAETDCVALVSTSLASDWWPSESAMGQEVDVNLGSAQCTVVGRVSDSRHTAVPAASRGDRNLYFSLEQWPSTRLSWVYAAPRASPRDIEEWIHAQGPGVTVRSRNWLGDRQAERTRPLRRAAGISGILALLAILLGLLSTHHAVHSHALARRRSLALRAAIGASPARIGLRIVRVGVVPHVMGLVVGAILCLVSREFIAGGLGINETVRYGLASAALLLGSCAAASVAVVRSNVGRDVTRSLRPD